MFKNNQEISWRSGVNLKTLKNCGIVFPVRDWWKYQICKASSFLSRRHDDLRIFNLIAIPGGVLWIDYCLTPDGKIVVNTIDEDMKSFSL